MLCSVVMECAQGCGACANTGCYITRLQTPRLPQKQPITIKDMQIPPPPLRNGKTNFAYVQEHFKTKKNVIKECLNNLNSSDLKKIVGTFHAIFREKNLKKKMTNQNCLILRRQMIHGEKWHCSNENSGMHIFLFNFLLYSF